MLGFWIWRYSTWGTVKTPRKGSGNETSSCLESINVSGIRFNFTHLHVHGVVYFAGSSGCTVLVSSFLLGAGWGGAERERIEVVRHRVDFFGLLELPITSFFFLIKM